MGFLDRSCCSVSTLCCFGWCSIVSGCVKLVWISSVVNNVQQVSGLSNGSKLFSFCCSLLFLVVLLSCMFSVVLKLF